MDAHEELRSAYEFLESRLSETTAGGAERILASGETLALYAASFPPGRLVHVALENLILDLANRHTIRPAATAPWTSRSTSQGSTLHVASRVSRVGGHTRVLERWIARDKTSQHYVVLTHQGDEPLPELFTSSVSRSGALWAMPHAASIAERVALLMGVVDALVPDRLILHQHPWDVVPGVALAVPGPPTAVFNHADHLPWVGAVAADVVIDFRNQATDASLRRRGARAAAVLPLPAVVPFPQGNRGNAKMALGLSSDTVVLVSVAVPYKYRPSREHNFFRSLSTLLKGHSGCHAFVIGVTPEIAARYNGAALDWRVHCLGVVEDAAPYLAAADIYLESFPVGAGLGGIDACAYGAAPVLGYGPLNPLFAVEQPSLPTVVPLRNEAEWLVHVSDLITDRAKRDNLGMAARTSVESHHHGGAWEAAVSRLYERMAAGGHTPAQVSELGVGDPQPDLPRGMDWDALAVFGVGGPCDLARHRRRSLSPVEHLRLVAAGLRIGEVHGPRAVIKNLAAAILP